MDKLAISMSIKILSRKPMSANQLYDKLISKGITDDSAQDVVEHMKELGFIDDIKFAKFVVGHYSNRGFSEYRICMELKKRGISEDNISTVMQDYLDCDDVILKLIGKKLKGNTADDKLISRTIMFLKRRGYRYDKINSYLNTYICSLDVDNTED